VILAQFDAAGWGELLVGLSAVLTVMVASRRQGHKTRSELRPAPGPRAEPTFADEVFARFDRLDGRHDDLREAVALDRRVSAGRHAANVRRLDTLDGDVSTVKEELREMRGH
jgi:hypothetical protein